MTKPGDDETDFREGFAALRGEDSAKTPAFETLLAGAAAGRGRGRRLPRWGGLLAAASLVAAALAAVAVLRPPRTPSRAASIEEWTAPTDFLLRTPGREILETVPRIGARPDLAPFESAIPRGAVRKPRSVSP
jgi:hypothetical protein